MQLDWKLRQKESAETKRTCKIFDRNSLQQAIFLKSKLLAFNSTSKLQLEISCSKFKIERQPGPSTHPTAKSTWFKIGGSRRRCLLTPLRKPASSTWKTRLSPPQKTEGNLCPLTPPLKNTLSLQSKTGRVSPSTPPPRSSSFKVFGLSNIQAWSQCKLVPSVPQRTECTNKNESRAEMNMALGTK